MKSDTKYLLNDVVQMMEQLAGNIRAETHEVNASSDHIEVIRHYNDLRGAMDRIKVARKALEELESILSKEMVPDAMAAAKVKTITIEGIGRITVSRRFSASIIDDPDTGKLPGYTWLRENHAGSLVTETVNSSSLAAFAKDMVENQARDLPEDIFKVGTVPYTSITKAK